MIQDLILFLRQPMRVRWSKKSVSDLPITLGFQREQIAGVSPTHLSYTANNNWHIGQRCSQKGLDINTQSAAGFYSSQLFPQIWIYNFPHSQKHGGVEGWKGPLSAPLSTPPKLKQGHPEQADLSKTDLKFLKDQNLKEWLVKSGKITHSCKILSSN